MSEFKVPVNVIKEPEPDLDPIDKDSSANIDIGESLFGSLFQGTDTGGDEELLRVATSYTRQFNSDQIKGIILLKWISKIVSDRERSQINDFIDTWLDIKQYNNSSAFVRQIVDSIAIKRLVNANNLKVNIEKQ